MKILILLGDRGEYLTYKVFHNDTDLDLFIDKIHPLMIANIQRIRPLKKRLELIKDDYFLYAGAVIDFDIIDLENELIPTT